MTIVVVDNLLVRNRQATPYRDWHHPGAKLTVAEVASLALSVKLLPTREYHACAQDTIQCYDVFLTMTDEVRELGYLKYHHA